MELTGNPFEDAATIWVRVNEANAPMFAVVTDDQNAFGTVVFAPTMRVAEAWDPQTGEIIGVQGEECDRLKYLVARRIQQADCPAEEIL